MKNSHIQWTDHTWNPWIGCTKVDALCDHCYAETRDIRWANGVHWGPGAARQRTSASNWKEPLKWNREAQAASKDGVFEQIPRPRVFCASLSDWTDNEVPIEWLADMLHVVDQCRNLDWLLLSKRPQLWRSRLERCVKDALTGGELGPRAMIERWLAGEAPPHIWMGTSVGDQKSADLRVPALLKIPAKIRFLSCEPLLGPVDLEYPESMFPGGPPRCCSGEDCGCMGQPTEPPLIYGINWLIVGGESGAGARAMDPEWAFSLRRQAESIGAAFFMKQMGGTRNKRGELSDIPMDLQVREFPK